MCKEASLVFIPVEKVEENESSWWGAYERLWPSVVGGVLRWESVYSSAKIPFPYPVKLVWCPPTV